MSGWQSAPVVDDEEQTPRGAWASAPVVDDAPAPAGGFLNDEDKVGGRAARLAVQAVPRALGGMAALVGDVGINTGKAMFNAGRRSVGKPEIDNPPLPLSTALANSTERWATQLGLPEMPKEGVAGYLGRGAETATEALTGVGLAGLGARALRSAAPTVARGVEGLATGPVQQVAAGLAGQAGSEAAGYLAPDSMAARLIGAGLGTVGGIGGSVAARQGWEAARRGVGNQGDAVALEVARRSSNPEQLVQDLSRPNVQAPGGLTAGQQSGDLGLLSLERDVMRNTETGPERFAAKTGEQVTERNRQLNAIQPEGNISDLQTTVQDLLRRADEAGEAGEQTARSEAQAATAAIDPGRPETVGSRIRGNVSEARQTYRTDIEKPLWDAVDPEGRLVVPTQSAREAAHEAYGTLDPRAQRRLGADERAFSEDVGQLEPEVPFRHLQTLESDLKDAMRAENRAAGETAKYRRLSILQRAVRGAMSDGAVAAAEANPSVAARLRGMRDEFGAQAGPSDSGVYGEARSVQAGGVPPARPETGAGVGGPRPAPGSDGVRPAARPRGKGLTLSQFISRNGGLALDDEAAARDFGNVTVPGVGGKLARPNGRSIDGFWRNKLIDEGYLPPDADGGASRDITKELYDALEAERAGRVTRSAADERNQPLPGMDDEGAAHASAVSQIRDEWKRAGLREDELHSGALNDAAERLARGEEKDGLTAYERAVMDLDEAPAARPSYPEVPEPEGGFPNALTGGPERDPDVGARYNAATRATRTKHDIWTRGAPGPVLKTTGQQGDFRMSATAVPGHTFTAGRGGAERVQQMVRGGATPQDIGDAAALSLLDKTRDGVLTPEAYAAWRRSHAEAISQLPPDVVAQFGSASLAGERLSRAIERRRTVMQDAQKSALGKVAGAADAEELQGRISSMLGSKTNASRQIGQLLSATRNNAPAREGLKRAIIEDVIDRTVSNSSEAAASGSMNVSANKLQGLLNNKRGLLVSVFGEPHVQTMEAVADDIIKAQRSTSGGVKIQGGSDTAQNISRQLDKSARRLSEHGLLGTIITRGSWGAQLGSKAGGVGSLVGGAAGAAVGLGEAAIGAARAAGIRQFDALMVETLLDPALTRAAAARGLALKNAERGFARRVLDNARKLAAPAASIRPSGSEDTE